MATAAYYAWVKAGRKWSAAQPIADVVAYAKTAGVGWLGTLGSDDTRHLQADRPQDHTPFSVTAWPLPLPGYIVTACDLARGPWCERFLAECRAGIHPWVKYINFGGHHYNVKTGWREEYSSDQHFHVSCRTDYLNARALNPFVFNAIRESEEMAGFARDGSGQLYYVNGMDARPIDDDDMKHIIYTSEQGFSPELTNRAKAAARTRRDDPTEWEGDWVRLGFGTNWAGRVKQESAVEAVGVATVEQGVRNVFHGA
jgi:hypothetical protein